MHFYLTAESRFGDADLRIVEYVVAFAFEGGVRLQVDSNVQVAGPSSQSSVPFTAQSQTLTLICSRRHFYLQLRSLPRESVTAAVLARLIDHRPCPIAFGTG